MTKRRRRTFTKEFKEQIVQLHASGKPRAELIKEYHGKAKRRLVHRLVAIAFVPNPDNKPIVNHIDSNRLNSKKGNLEWVNHKENSEHMVNSFRSSNQTMTILLDKIGNEICVFPSRSRCITYIFNRFRKEHGYDEGEAIVEYIEFYTELSYVVRDVRVALRYKLCF